MDSESRGILGKIFGGLDMSWRNVIIYAVVSAFVTFLFLVIPAFAKTSLVRVGETLEAWFLLAIIVMTNCKTPLESALKTFVYFLISQPLIYLFQVPFSYMGWGLFGYYRYWAMWTVLTLPMAYIGWYITKRNWLSVLILAPVIAFLAMTGWQGFVDAFRSFPNHLLVGIFCYGQILLYIFAFMPDLRQKAVGIAIALAVTVFLAFTTSPVDLSVSDYLPDVPVLTDNAAAVTGDPEIATVQVSNPPEGKIYIHATKYGTTDLIITDGDREYHYTLTVENENGVSKVRIEKVSDQQAD